MARAPIPDDVLARVLTRSRRRCCICYGLNRDTSIKAGQIAHIDQDSSNPAEDNLAFLCFEHHDRVDSRTSQSKNFTITEIKHFREELHAAISMAFGAASQFGDAKASLRGSGLHGDFVRGGQYESAQLTIRQLMDGSYRVVGEALWGTHREYGPNLGMLDFLADPGADGAIEYSEKVGGDDGNVYKIRIELKGARLVVTEENFASGIFGMNVNFSGEYDRAS